MANPKINIQVASEHWKDSARVVAEISYEGQDWAYVYQEDSQMFIDLYPKADGKQWTIPYNDALKALHAAQVALQFKENLS